MRKIYSVFLCGLFAVPTSLLYAQTESAERDFVLEAIAELNEHDFQTEINAETLLTIYREDVAQIITTQTFADQVNYTTNGDYSAQRNLRVQAESEVDNFLETGSIDLSLRRVDDVEYIQIVGFDASELVEIPNIELGAWLTLEEYVENMESDTLRIAFLNLAQIQHPLLEDYDEDTILSVTELDNETLDGVTMRVFDVEVDAIELSFRQQMRSLRFIYDRPDEEVVAEMEAARGQSMPEGTIIEGTFRVWVGEEDGLLYQWEVTSYSWIEYDTFTPIETMYQGRFYISHYDDIGPITTPEIE